MFPPPSFYIILLHFSHNWSNWSFLSSSSTTFWNLLHIPDLNCPSSSTLQCYATMQHITCWQWLTLYKSMATESSCKHMRTGLKIFVGLVCNMKYPPGNVASCVTKVLHGITVQNNGVLSHTTMETSRRTERKQKEVRETCIMRSCMIGTPSANLFRWSSNGEWIG